MKDNDLITRREVELALLEKGQRSRRYSLGEVWELNFDEIREALSGYQPKIVRCRDCKYWSAERINDFNKCRRWIKVGVKNFATMGDWFCADGKRR